MTSAEEQVFAVSPEHYSSTQTTASTTVTHGLTIYTRNMRKESFRCNKYVRHTQNTHKWLFEFLLAVAGYTTIGEKLKIFESKEMNIILDFFYM